MTESERGATAAAEPIDADAEEEIEAVEAATAAELDTTTILDAWGGWEVAPVERWADEADAEADEGTTGY